MKAVVYKGNGEIRLEERPMPVLKSAQDAIVQVTMTTICSSDIHIRHGAVPRAVTGVILGHEFVGKVVETGSAVTNVKLGDRVAVNVETYCGDCFSAGEGLSIIVRIPWAAGRLDAGSTAARRNMCGFPMQITD